MARAMARARVRARVRARARVRVVHAPPPTPMLAREGVHAEPRQEWPVARRVVRVKGIRLGSRLGLRQAAAVACG